MAGCVAGLRSSLTTGDSQPRQSSLPSGSCMTT
jgi:hypothetical protein